MHNPDLTAPADTGATLAIAGFWRRLGAFIIDMLLLGAVGMALGLLLHAQFAALGAWGRAVGFVIAVAYFGVTESRAGGGQSLGKKLLGLKVVNRTGTPLRAPAAFGRAAIFCLAYFLNGASLNPEFGRQWIMLLQSVLIMSLLLGVFYLLVFNRRTRQSLHDLAVGAYVIKTGPGVFARPALPVWRGHFVIVGVAVVGLSAAGMLLMQQPMIAGVLATHRAISALPALNRITVNANVGFGGANKKRQLVISAFVDATSTPNPEAVALQVAQTALNNYADVNNQQAIVVTILSGYDIGIASGQRWVTYARSPAQWRALAIQRSV